MALVFLGAFRSPPKAPSDTHYYIVLNSILIYRSMHIVQLWVFSWECFFSNSFSELYYFFGIRCRRHLVPKKQ